MHEAAYINHEDADARSSIYNSIHTLLHEVSVYKCISHSICLILISIYLSVTIVSFLSMRYELSKANERVERMLVT